MPVTIRPATLDDVPAIRAIHVSDILAWKRWDAEREEHLARYEELTAYERWLNGGPWMDESALRPHLQRLLDGAGHALVAERDGQVLAEAEAFVGDEPPPWGRNLNLSVLYVRRGSHGLGLGGMLMSALFDLARWERCESLIVTHAEAAEFYARYGLSHWATWRAARLPALQSGTQYTAQPLDGWDYESVRGWGMPVGRYQSARQEWERLAPGAAPDFPEWRALRTERWRITVRRAPAVLLLDELPHETGTANVHLWTSDGTMSRQLLAAVRDRAARSSFGELKLFVPEKALSSLVLRINSLAGGGRNKLFVPEKALSSLGPEAKPDDYCQEAYGCRLEARPSVRGFG